MILKFISLITALAILFPSFAQVKPDDVVGTWRTSGKESAKIQIYKSGDKYFGKIVWLRNPSKTRKPRVDFYLLSRVIAVKQQYHRQ